MLTPEERLRVLQDIEAGRISPEDGVRLLQGDEAQTTLAAAAPVSNGAPRWLRVLVTDTTTGKVTVNLRLPVNLLEAGQKLGAHISAKVDGMSMERIKEYVRAGYVGPVLDILDDDEDEHVQILLE